MSSYKRDRTRSRSRERSRSESSERSIDLPNNSKPIAESDYFLRSDEFRVWLRDDKRKYLDELSSDRARKYFRKFVKAWNRGKLPKDLYYGVEAQTASSQTGYKWSFASKASEADSKALRQAREEVGAATYSRSTQPSSSRGGSGRVLGPTLPNQSDLVLAREEAEELRTAERDRKRKRDRKEEKERVEDLVGPKAVGKEGMLEAKRARREADRSFREKGDEGLEADESTLMGGGDSFRDFVARRDAARKRADEKRHGPREERDAAMRERATAMRQKDRATMDMFAQMAKEKFG